VTEADRRLAVLAAALARERAAALVLRLATPAAADAATHARALAEAPRAERLQALAAALSGSACSLRARGEAAAAAERPRVAALLVSVASGAPAVTAAPVLVRLCRERLRS
jgi:hypothetical protein